MKIQWESYLYINLWLGGYFVGFSGGGGGFFYFFSFFVCTVH